eukprot:CAMPEP_0184324256 /NCGR_PEP_ID=MMETSP1049-20130417/134288_1 /TAXON_ID=77928 /ORGANISM="Proteomonas sulcata, Strain CCMP704" /LENGTH=62 /DNA_ID=CAMNT_0026645977 /DNA_START=30 /DNA_END=215 /DNA_ORIENTATION=-
MGGAEKEASSSTSGGARSFKDRLAEVRKRKSVEEPKVSNFGDDFISLEPEPKKANQSSGAEG